MKPATVDGVHNILHQIFDMAVDDNYIRNNPTNNVLRELKKDHCFKTEKRRGLTRPEQELFMDYLKNSKTAVYWYPVFAVMLGTGRSVSDFARVHSIEGSFTRSQTRVNGKPVYGTYKGIRVGVIRTNAKIATVFPASDRNPVFKKRRK